MYGRAKSWMFLYKLTITGRRTNRRTEKATDRGSSFRSAQKLFAYCSGYKATYNPVYVSFCPLVWDILISSFQNIPNHSLIYLCNESSDRYEFWWLNPWDDNELPKNFSFLEKVQTCIHIHFHFYVMVNLYTLLLLCVCGVRCRQNFHGFWLAERETFSWAQLLWKQVNPQKCPPLVQLKAKGTSSQVHWLWKRVNQQECPPQF